MLNGLSAQGAENGNRRRRLLREEREGRWRRGINSSTKKEGQSQGLGLPIQMGDALAA
jgi:hypothetical protein